jgi:hypothetical protein
MFFVLIWNTGIHFRGASTDSFTVCQRVSSVPSSLMLSHPDLEVFWLFKICIDMPGQSSFHIMWNCQNVMFYGRAELCRHREGDVYFEGH